MIQCDVLIQNREICNGISNIYTSESFCGLIMRVIKTSVVVVSCNVYRVAPPSLLSHTGIVPLVLY